MAATMLGDRHVDPRARRQRGATAPPPPTAAASDAPVDLAWRRLPASHPCHVGATVGKVPRAVSVRQLKNQTTEVMAAMQAGERLQLTVDRTPVADIVPHVPQRGPWVPSDEVRRILHEAPADSGLLDDLAGVRDDLVDDWE